MTEHSYSVSILLLLDLGSGLTAYDLSKVLGRFDRRVSNGTIVPVMNKFIELGYVTFRMEGRRKVYTITPSGKKYVASVRKIREGLKRSTLAGILGRNAVYLGLLASVDDMEVLERMLSHVDEGLTRFLGAAFRLEKEGNEEKVSEINRRLRLLAEEYAWANL